MISCEFPPHRPSGFAPARDSPRRGAGPDRSPAGAEEEGRSGERGGRTGHPVRGALRAHRPVGRCQPWRSHPAPDRPCSRNRPVPQNRTVTRNPTPCSGPEPAPAPSRGRRSRAAGPRTAAPASRLSDHRSGPVVTNRCACAAARVGRGCSHSPSPCRSGHRRDRHRVRARGETAPAPMALVAEVRPMSPTTHTKKPIDLHKPHVKSCSLRSVSLEYRLRWSQAPWKASRIRGASGDHALGASEAHGRDGRVASHGRSAGEDVRVPPCAEIERTLEHRGGCGEAGTRMHLFHAGTGDFVLDNGAVRRFVVHSLGANRSPSAAAEPLVRRCAHMLIPVPRYPDHRIPRHHSCRSMTVQGPSRSPGEATNGDAPDGLDAGPALTRA